MNNSEQKQTMEIAKHDEATDLELSQEDVGTKSRNNRDLKTEHLASHKAELEEPNCSTDGTAPAPLSSSSSSKGRRCNLTRVCCGICILLLLVIIGVIVWFRVAFRGFFTPRCARPKREIDSMDSLGLCIDKIADMYDMVGLSVAISTDEGLQWNHNYGYANLDDKVQVTGDTPFLLSSVSKTFIATAIMQQVEASVLDLDEDINTYLKSFQIENPKVDGENVITLRHLSTHTSGLIDNDNVYDASYAPGDPLEDLSSFLKEYFVPDGKYYSASKNFRNCKSGDCSYDYSNIAASLAALVVEDSAGMPYHQYVEENILKPLGMSQSHFYFDNYTDPSVVAMPYEEDGEEYGYYGYPTYPDGRLLSSSNDMARYMTAFMVSNEDLMDFQTRDEMLSPQSINQKIGLAERLFYGKEIDQEIFWTYVGDTAHGHDGGDFGSFTLMYFEPIHKVGITVLTNHAKINAAIALMQIVKQVTSQSERVRNLLDQN